METVKKQALELLDKTGYEQVSLTSLSTGDYSKVERLVTELAAECRMRGVSVSLPSLRVDSFSVKLAEEIEKFKKTGLTFAPEAGTQRLRDVINKNVREEDLYEAVEAAFSSGWHLIKLYFMIGLPTETYEDLDGIAALARNVLEIGRRSMPTSGKRPTVNISVASFVPKPGTPFQWEAFNDQEVLLAKFSYLRKRLKHPGIKFNTHDVRTSYLEAVFSRGDRRLGRVLARAVDLGCQFDGWNEHFRYDLWMQAFRDACVDSEFYAYRRRGADEILPWEHLLSGVSKKFLWLERERPIRASLPTTAASVHRLPRARIWALPTGCRAVNRLSKNVRLRFSVGEPGRFISHLDVLRLMSRAVRRAGLPIAYSQGFSPTPRLAFASSLPVGVTSAAEYVDLQLNTPVEWEQVKNRLNDVLPDGFRILAGAALPEKYPPLMSLITTARYQIKVLGEAPDLEKKTADLTASGQILASVKRKNKEEQVDVRGLIDSLAYDPLQRLIELQCASGVQANLRPMDLLPLLGLELRDVLIHRTDLLIKAGAGRLLTPFDV